MKSLKLFDRPIAFHRCFVTLTGTLPAAVMLSQAIYWSLRTTDPEGWFYKNAEEWEEETGMTRREQEGARIKLRKTGFWEEKLKGSPPTLHFRVNEEILQEQISQIGEMHFDKKGKSNFTKSENQISQKGEFEFDEKGKSNSTKQRTRIRQKGKHLLGTETTTEITTETTTKNKSNPRADARHGLSSDADEIFEFWKAEMNHPDAKLIGKRERLIKARLNDGYTVDQIKTAIRGCRASPFHQGQNEHGRIHDDLTLICRDGSKLENFIRIYERESNGTNRPATGKTGSRETHNERAARQTVELLFEGASHEAADAYRDLDPEGAPAGGVAADYSEG